MEREGGGPIIAVIGGGLVGPEDAALADAVGRELAQRGATVVCGGLGGVMEAVCRGAKAAGGRTIGVLPGHLAESANPYVDIPIVTGMGFARNVIVVLTGQAVIAIAGSFGTLSEIGLARGFGIPVVGLATWQITPRDGEDAPYLPAGSPAEAVALALEAARTAPPRRIPEQAVPWRDRAALLDQRGGAATPAAEPR
jgi:uncharacterized protein (TIGR00725 family)